MKHMQGTKTTNNNTISIVVEEKECELSLTAAIAAFSTLASRDIVAPCPNVTVVMEYTLPVICDEGCKETAFSDRKAPCILLYAPIVIVPGVTKNTSLYFAPLMRCIELLVNVAKAAD